MCVQHNNMFIRLIYSTTLFFLLNSNVSGQSENYRGGNGRGDNFSRSKPSYLTGEILGSFLGGTGRGESLSKTLLVYFNMEYSLPFSGGNGRGDYKIIKSPVFLNGEVISSYFGGSGRGDIVSDTSMNFPGGSVFVNLNLFLQGFYTGGGTMRAVFDPANYPSLCDSITIELRNSFSPHTLSYSGKAMVNLNGLASIVIPSLYSGNNYYFALRHRNSLAVWSSSSLMLTNTSQINYSFTNAAASAYQNNLAPLADGNFALWSGDINQDEKIDQADVDIIEMDLPDFRTGYFNSDITGDRLTESSDYSLLENNSKLGIEVEVP